MLIAVNLIWEVVLRVFTASHPGQPLLGLPLQLGFALLLLPLAVFGQSAPARSPQPPAEDPPIADNSFLLEEAYNQEQGVVQHINSFFRIWSTKAWSYSFTQEWPFNPAPRHQLSYTLLAVNGLPGASGGMGDVLLNYRYQVAGAGAARFAFAPRASVLIPSGDWREGRGIGGAGMQFNLPFSYRVARRLVTHWNAGTTIIPRAKNEFGDTATSYSVNLGQSFIWQVHPRFNPMLETVFNRVQVVTGPSATRWESSVLVNPGFRWAYNFSNGLQIVPGISFPVELHRSGRGDWGVLIYLSFEHPFGRTKEK